MNQNGIVTFREELEGVMGRYHDFLGDEAQRLCREYSIPTGKNLQADLAAIADEGRLLKIGIVGRVKSGKSSLLNALLFDGESILPKAATPMTAALTTLSHGDTPSAEVEFFTQEDFENIKAQYEEYNRQWDDLYRKFLAQGRQRQTRSRKSPEELAKSKAYREMRAKVELSAAHEQYTKMDATRLSIRTLEEKRLLEFDRISDLGDKLDDYVGAKGKYMPFTKSVNLRLSQEKLKDIEIVDTPGLNDPVQSREARTQEHLNQCDVVLILSPSGQFLNDVDLELMDRITSKEGIHELFVVAAQADTQLFGHLKDENDGQLDRVLDSLTGVLGDQLNKVITNLKESNPEVGNTYDQLLEGQSKIIYSSGMCESLKQLFGQRGEWDEGMRHAWDSLLRDYPDYFSDADENLSRISLNKLSNISAIQNIVADVRAKKDDIIQKRRTEYVDAKRQSLRALKDGLLAFADERQSEIEGTDIEKIKAQREALENALYNASADIKWGYEELVDNLSRSLAEEFRRKIEGVKKSTESDIDQGKEMRMRTERWGFFWLFKREVSYPTIRTGAVSHSLSEFSEELVYSITKTVEDKKGDWRTDLIRDMAKILRDNFGDESLEASMIRRVIRDAISSISIPKFEYKSRMPDSLKPQGVLEDDAAEEFIDKAKNYLDNLSRELSRKANEYPKVLAAKMKEVRLDDQLLKKIEKELTTLEESIENKEMELRRISRLKGELKKMEVNP